MKQIRGDLWKQYKADGICITTNGFTKSDGTAVMGKGCAKEAANRVPRLPALLGNDIREKGNIVQILHPYKETQLISFPVKPVSKSFHDNTQVVGHMKGRFNRGGLIPGWACVADIGIIEDSAKALMRLIDVHNLERVVLPRPGCGAGELRWSTVSRVIRPILDDRVSVITF